MMGETSERPASFQPPLTRFTLPFLSRCPLRVGSLNRLCRANSLPSSSSARSDQLMGATAFVGESEGGAFNLRFSALGVSIFCGPPPPEGTDEPEGAKGDKCVISGLGTWSMRFMWGQLGPSLQHPVQPSLLSSLLEMSGKNTPVHLDLRYRHSRATW
ncbi:hypothetical protein BD779DRAFT_270418 [Infundibulicybe gibba]|nr:hypothetical protein BD779DRAFT_270418 [Infundibulicybe gibba]